MEIPRRPEIERLRARLSALPVRRAQEALLNCFARSLETLTRDELGQLRERVVAHFGATHSFVDIIDGHAALREIRESE